MPQAAVRPVKVRCDGWAAGRPVSQGQRRAATAISGRRVASEIRKARPATAGITALTRAAATRPARVVAVGRLREAGVWYMAVLLEGAVRRGARPPGCRDR